MKISIIGAGNMGGAIACGLAISEYLDPSFITVIDHRGKNVERLKRVNDKLNVVVSDYSSLSFADIVIVAVKPWMVEEVLNTCRDYLINADQLIASVAANVSLNDLENWTHLGQPVFRIMPNTAIAVRQSMTYIASKNANKEKCHLIHQLFDQLGKVNFVDEKMMPALTSLTSCGIAFALRYIRAAMEGGIEMGIYPDDAKNGVLQTLRGAIDLLEANGTNPEVEIDKVTTPGGITIKGLNEMEHSGFTSSVIKGLKASHTK